MPYAGLRDGAYPGTPSPCPFAKAMLSKLFEQASRLARRLCFSRELRWAAASAALLTSAGVACGEEPFSQPASLVATRPEQAGLPLTPGTIDYVPPPPTDIEARVQALEEIIRKQAARQRELEEQVSFQPASGGAPAAPAAPKPYVVGSDTAMSGKWTANGGELQSKNGDFKFKLAGRVQADAAFVQSPDPNTITSIPGGAGTKDGVFFRRLRLGGYGTMYDTIDWATEFDIANTEFNVDPAAGGNNPPTGLRSSTAFPAGGNVMSVVAPTDVWMTFREMPIGNVRVGNQKEMIGLEHMNSSRFLDFMERSPLQDAFNGPNNNGFTPGITAYNAIFDENMTWGAGVFKNNDYDSGFPFDVGDTNYVYNGRVTWTPWYDEASEGRYLLHTGLGSVVRTFDTNPAAYTGGTNVRIRARGDVRNMPSTLPPNYVDTGNFYATSQTLLNPELALVYGPWLFQAEYEWCNMGGAAQVKGGPALGTTQFQGGYAQVLYFLTGENRAYNRKTANFGRVVPYENMYRTKDTGFCGLGAWQLGFRYDWLDLNSGGAAGVNGGNVQNFTLGLNWFLNPNTKIQFNYVNANPNSVTPVAGLNNSLNGSHFVGNGTINSFGTRLAWDF
jgi:phosphate-selective porin OprO/OprP